MQTNWPEHAHGARALRRRARGAVRDRRHRGHPGTTRGRVTCRDRARPVRRAGGDRPRRAARLTPRAAPLGRTTRLRADCAAARARMRRAPRPPCTRAAPATRKPTASRCTRRWSCRADPARNRFRCGEPLVPSAAELSTAGGLFRQPKVSASIVFAQSAASACRTLSSGSVVLSRSANSLQAPITVPTSSQHSDSGGTWFDAPSSRFLPCATSVRTTTCRAPRPLSGARDASAIGRA